jgi:5-formyltetrahydrofolate cyclo-ligase
MSQGAEPAVQGDKLTLRRAFRAQRRSLSAQRDRAADANTIVAAAGELLDSLSLDQDRSEGNSSCSVRPCVAIYRSLPTEPPTEALAEMLHARGVQVIVPETLPDFDLEWRELRADGSEGPRLGLEGIAAAQVVIAPALAVDHSGTRLGKGGGCYDRALARRHPSALIVALVNDEEYVVGPLPHEPYDVPVQAVITTRSGFTPIPGPKSPA